MQTYLDLLRHILEHGEPRRDRTGVGTVGVFGHQARFDLRRGFPLLTTKRIHFKSVLAELLWFLSGDTDARTLQRQGVTIWDEWATDEQCAKFDRKPGDMGPIYGWQWRHFGAEYEGVGSGVRPCGDSKHDEHVGFDQIAWVEQEIVRNPFSRRLVVSAWNPADAQRVALPPCHTLFQFYVSEPSSEALEAATQGAIREAASRDVSPFGQKANAMQARGSVRRELSCHLYARSIDAFLGLPFNLASYALLTHLMAHSTGLGVGELTISFGDLHIYRNHLDQVREQLSRDPRPLPTLRIDPLPRSARPARPGILGYEAGDFAIDGYDPHPAIRAEVAV